MRATSAGGNTVTLQPLATLDEAFMILSATSVAVGWYQIRHRRVRLHRRFMLTGAVLGVLFFITYAVKTLTVGDTAFGGPRLWATPYQIFLQIHTIFATLTAVAGIITLRWAFRRRFRKHRRIGPWTASAWLITATSGLMVFLLLYVVFPPGPTSTNLLHVLLRGH
jgi:putative membrane protein